MIVVTPSLNKSFKFQSDWPYNNSQVYLLSSIIDDLKTDEDREFKEKNNGYFFSSKVLYPNNKSLVKQNVYVNKKGKITKVEVVDKEGNAQIIMNFTKIQYNKKFEENYFELNNILKINNKNETSKKETAETKKQENQENNTGTTSESTNTTTNENTNTSSTATTNTNTNGNNTPNTTKPTSSINDIVYPMHLPNNTYLTNQEKVSTETGERLILTFSGDSNFILVEETSKMEEESMIIPVNGEFDFLTDVIGVIDTHSLSWHSNGIDYYLASNVIETSELIDIARSISILPVSK